jgi:hypothetical protein
MSFLQVTSFLPYKGTHNSFLQLESIRTAVSGNVSLSNASDTLSVDTLAELYGCWVRDNTSSKVNYDVFISYRWNDFDTKLADALFDKTASDQVVITKNNRAVNVFLDRNRLKDGLNFVDSFANSLFNSTVVVPLMTAKALERMFTHDPATRDNVLLEWLITLECVSAGKIEKVYPILVGSTDADGNVAASFFASVKLDLLPDVVPVETFRYSIFSPAFCLTFMICYVIFNMSGLRLIFSRETESSLRRILRLVPFGPL